MANKITTRESTNVFLVGQPLQIISEENAHQLPTTGVVLRRLYHCLKVKGLNLSQSCNEVAVEVMEFWDKSNIPTTQFPNVVSKLKRLHAEHVSVIKNRISLRLRSLLPWRFYST